MLKRPHWPKLPIVWDARLWGDVASAAKPEILLRWYRELIAKRFDGSEIPQIRGTLSGGLRGRASR
jgi:hypothetical protein